MIRILMRTKHKYYAGNHGYIVNLFEIDPQSSTTNNFLLCLVLNDLARSRKKQGELGIEGYRRVSAIVSDMTWFGFLEEDVMWALNYLVRNRLVGSDSQSTEGVGREDYVKILASGFIHIRVLLKRLEYLGGAAADTWLRNKSLTETIARAADLNADQFDRRVVRLRWRAKVFLHALEVEYDALRSQCQGADRLTTLDRVIADLEGALSHETRVETEEEFNFE